MRPCSSNRGWAEPRHTAAIVQGRVDPPTVRSDDTARRLSPLVAALARSPVQT